MRAFGRRARSSVSRAAPAEPSRGSALVSVGGLTATDVSFHGAASNARSPGGRAVHHGNGAPSSSPSASRLRQRAGSPSPSPNGRAPTGGKLTAAGRCGCGWRARRRLSRHCGSAAASSHSHHPVARHTAVHDSIAREVYADPTSSTVPVSSCPPWHMLPPVRCSPRGCLACDKLSEATRTTL